MLRLIFMKPSLQHNVTVSSSFNGLCQKFSLYISALSVFHQCSPAGRAERIIYVFVVTMQRRGVKHLFFLFRKRKQKCVSPRPFNFVFFVFDVQYKGSELCVPAALGLLAQNLQGNRAVQDRAPFCDVNWSSIQGRAN